MMLLDMINKLGAGHGAWTMMFVVPATRSGGDYRAAADRYRQRQAESPHAQEPRNGGVRHQGTGQRNDIREQRKLQAEDDCVVLLCRD